MWCSSYGRKDEGWWFAPVTVGEVLWQLISKCISRVVNVEAFRTLSPLQVGVGVHAGCEAVVHAVNSVHDDSSIPSGSKWTLLLDFANTFHCINHEAIFEQERARVPSMASGMES